MSYRTTPDGMLIANNSCWSCGTEDNIHLCDCEYSCKAHCPTMSPATYRNGVPTTKDEPVAITLSWHHHTNVPDTEISVEFLQGMLNRMAVSFHKYGRVADAYPHDLSALASAQQRLAKYQETGNTEYLIDAANFFMIEFKHPSIPGARYAPTDSDGSPGRTTRRGHVTDAPNGDKKTWL